MFNLNCENAPAYFASRTGSSGLATVEELGGGVSNTVLLVENAEGRFVIKQSLERLRVHDEWFSDRARIYRECAALQALGTVLPPNTLPRVVFEDKDNYVFAMTAAPREAETWKALLLRGNISDALAANAGRILAAIIRAGREDRALLERFGDQTTFDELRLDPYYRATAKRQPATAEFFEALIERCRASRYSLVHGDWSPKNLLVAGGHITVIDWEVVHAGDPSFDAAFLTNHLLLKGFYRPQWQEQYAKAAAAFWTALLQGLPADALPWFEQAAVRHLAGLLLARIDGKSPAEYITDAGMKERIRGFACDLIMDAPESMACIFTKQTQCL